MARTSALVLLLGINTVLANDPACSLSTFTPPSVPGAKVLSVKATQQRNYTSPPTIPPIFAVHNFSTPFCDVEVYLTHPGANDTVKVEIWLPLDDWNGRFQATGGGGQATGLFDLWLAPAVQQGYAAASTDGGHGTDTIDTVAGDWVLNSDGSINWALLHNFASRSLADQVHVGKSITEQYYGKAPHHSYWSGCSTGGRQGYAIAQKYPNLLDGILAIAPALYMSDIVIGEFWPQLVMKEEGRLMSKCEFDWIAAKVLEECDILDGVRDGVIEDPEVCTFDIETLVGKKMKCDEGEVEVSQTMTNIVRKIHDGPRTPFGAQLAHPLPFGAPLESLAGSKMSDKGVRRPAPFGVSDTWIRKALLKDANSTFNLSTLSTIDYFALWTRSQASFAWLLNTDNPDLKQFKKAGGKLLTWHGLADPLIPYHNTLRYWERVELEMGGGKAVSDFYRIFMAPGVGHCSGGTGPIPIDPLGQLVDWVEKGESPDRLEAETRDPSGEKVSKELCPWPQKNQYMGFGDWRRASSWSCVGGEEEIEEQPDSGKAGEFLGGLKDRLQGLGMHLNIG